METKEKIWHERATFEMFKFWVENILGDPLFNYVFIIETELDSYLDQNEQLKFLQEKHKILHPKNQEYWMYQNPDLLYYGWKDYFGVCFFEHNEFFANSMISLIDSLPAKPKDPNELNGHYLMALGLLDKFLKEFKEFNFAEYTVLMDFVDDWVKFYEIDFMLNRLKEQSKLFNKKDSIKIENCYNTKDVTSLKSLIRPELSYDELIDKLIDKGIIESNENGFRIPNKKKFHSCALGVKLKDRYIPKDTTHSKIVEALNNTFNADIGTSNFSAFFNSKYYEDYLNAIQIDN